MATALSRSSNVTQSNVNLYCAQCESQIGIFDNEWVRLTSSYARSKEKGTHFGTEIGHRTQVVPSGPAQRLAEGCVMAEVFCRKCSNMVGQYCKDAPDAEKQPLVDQYFYKLSRTYLKDSRTNARAEPVFGYGSDMVSFAGSKSSRAPHSGTTPTSRWASTPLRQSSRTPTVQTQGGTSDTTRRASQGFDVNATETVGGRWEQAIAEIRRVQEQMALQQSSIEGQSSQISDQTSRLDEQEAFLREQQANLEEHESCLSAQATQIVEQNEVIKDQTKRIEEQQTQLSKITNQLIKLQHTMDGLRTTLSGSRQSPAIQILSRGENESTGNNLESMAETTQETQNSAQEVQMLRAENQAMKTRLNTIASAMGVTPDRFALENIDTGTSTATSLNAAHTLGKRKRVDNGKPSSWKLGIVPAPLGNANSLSHGQSGQMPTPQSSDGGQRSPVQTPPIMSRQVAQQRKDSRPVEEAEKSGKKTMTKHSLAIHSSEHSYNKEADEANHDEYFYQPIPETLNLQQDIDTMPGISQKESVLSSERSGSFGAANHKASRQFQPRKSTETSNTRAESSILEPTQSGSRRLTRAAAKATQPRDAATDQNPRPMELDSQLFSSVNTPSQVDKATSFHDGHQLSPQAPLPTIQMASSVLGMNLQALIASSQAVGPGQGDQKPESEPAEVDNSSNQQAVGESSEPYTPALDSVGDSALTADATNDINNTLVQENGDDEVRFFQYSGADDGFGISDDDDDSMFADADLYGDDVLATNTEGLPERGLSSTAHPTVHGSSHSIIAPPVVRDDRSMAPEPAVRAKSTTSTIEKQMPLDIMHLMTPQMFVEAYAAGRQPKAVRPPAVQARARVLNAELRQLGLAEWIGKNKKCKEYRAAVTVARARFRNYNKAAHLWSRGLNHDLSEPSSRLPEQPLDRSAGPAQVEPLRTIENIASPTQSHPNSGMPDSGGVGDEVTSEQRRATRAYTRRSSVSLVSGLEDAENHAADVEVNKAILKRKPDGRRRSQRTSDIMTNKQEVHAEADKIENNINVMPAEQLINHGATAVTTEDEPVEEADPKRRKSSGRPRGRPRKSADPNVGREASIEDFRAAINEQVDARNVSAQVSGTSTAGAPVGNVVSSQTKQILSPKSQAQEREEAIMLRDRMAKELMECEDMDM